MIYDWTGQESWLEIIFNKLRPHVFYYQINHDVMFLNMYLRKGRGHVQASYKVKGQAPQIILVYTETKDSVLSEATELICPPTTKGTSAGCPLLPQGLSFPYWPGFMSLRERERETGRGRESQADRGTDRQRERQVDGGRDR